MHTTWLCCQHNSGEVLGRVLSTQVEEAFAALPDTMVVLLVPCAVLLLQAGQAEVLIDRLPGMPDGVDESPRGGYCKC